MNLQLLFLATFSSIILLYCGSQEAIAADEKVTWEDEARFARSGPFAEIDKAIFFELVKLAKFSINFHLEANHHQKWRRLTYPAGRETGTALTFAATLTELRQLSKGLDGARRISRNALKRAVNCGITGNAISGGASALELAQNAWVMMKAHGNGYSPDSSVAFVKQIVQNTDRLLLEREQLSAQLPSAQRRRVVELETQLIRRIRQQLLYEFARWSCHSRDQAWRENTFYTLDSLQSFARMTAGIIARRTFNHPELARRSIIWALVANSVATANPIVRNLVGIAVRKHQHSKLVEEIPCQRPMFSSELEDLEQKLAAETDEDWLKKVAALNYRTEKLDTELDRETREIERYRQIAQQQSVSGPMIGLTGVASSTMGTIAIYKYRGDFDTANKLGLAGRTTQGTGQAYALLNTPYTIVSGIIKNRRMAKRGELPSQILEERLKRLNRFN